MFVSVRGRGGISLEQIMDERSKENGFVKITLNRVKQMFFFSCSLYSYRNGFKD